MLGHPWPLMVAAGLYVIQAVAYARAGQWGNTLAWVSYALANLGFIWAWYER